MGRWGDGGKELFSLSPLSPSPLVPKSCVASAFVKRLAFVNSEQGLKAIAQSDGQTLKQSIQTSDK